MALKRAGERKFADKRRPELAGRGGRGSLPAGEHPQTLDFRRKNWLLMGGGLLAILIGFLVLSTGEITLAPILILAGYLVLIPWALVSRPRPEAGGAPGEAREP